MMVGVERHAETTGKISTYEKPVASVDIIMPYLKGEMRAVQEDRRLRGGKWWWNAINKCKTRRDACRLPQLFALVCTS